MANPNLFESMGNPISDLDKDPRVVKSGLDSVRQNGFHSQIPNQGNCLTNRDMRIGIMVESCQHNCKTVHNSLPA